MLIWFVLFMYNDLNQKGMVELKVHCHGPAEMNNWQPFEKDLFSNNEKPISDGLFHVSMIYSIK